jgi:hypothetical protein
MSTDSHAASKYSPFHAIIENLVLLSGHWEHSIEGKSILFRASCELGRPELDGSKRVVKRDDDLASFAQLYRVLRSKPAHDLDSGHGPVAEEGGIDGVGDVAGGLLALGVVKTLVENVRWSLATGGKHELNQGRGCAHGNGSCQVVVCSFHSVRLPVVFIETRLAPSRYFVHFLRVSLAFQQSKRIRKRNEFAWFAPPTVSKSGVLLCPACSPVYQNIFGQYRHHPLFMFKA